jgi:hypothetical protein
MLKQILKEGVAEKFKPLDIEQVAGFLYSIHCMFVVKTYVRRDSQQRFIAGIESSFTGCWRNDSPAPGVPGIKSSFPMRTV